MTRRWGGGSALLLAALLPAACMRSIEFDHPAVGGNGGVGMNGVGGGFGNGGNGFGDAGSTDAGVVSHLHCGNSQTISIAVSPETPSIMIALDRSPSMRNPLDTTTPRFQAAREALTATLMNYQSLAAFGYVEFPGEDSGDPSCTDGCCAGGFVPVIAPSSSSGATSSISQMMNKCWSPSTQTYNCLGSGVSPSGQALQKIAHTFQHTSSDGQLYALLLTDGPPTCPLFSSNMADSCDDAATQASNMNLGSPKIGTFVVTIGDIDMANVQCFTNLASAGGHPNTSGPTNYYVADTEALVHSQVDRIVASTICHLNINSQNQQPFDQNPSRLEVDVKGMSAPIPNVDSTNGYGVTTTASGTHIDFVGHACDTLIAARLKGSRVTVQGCPPSFPAPTR